ncbi:MAG: hypothetical protein JHC87_07265, partial [Thermoleophilaceae bacterium]|nr:hypothetical protein [Thermoleophilaceae bacterium]
VISIRAKVGAVDFGNIAVRQRLIVRGNAEGVDTISLDDVPQSIKGTQDANGAVVNANDEVHFHFRKLVLHLVGGTGATQKLLTSPSDCTPSAFSATFTSYAATTSTASQPYTATDCASLPFYTAFTANIKDLKDGSVPEPGDVATMTATVAASPDDSGVKRAEITLPTALTADAGGIPLGCEVSVYEATKVCPESTVVGTAIATTPILPTPIEGKVYFGRPKPGSFVVPGFDETLRLIIQLRGLVSIDLIGKTTLKDNKAITVFENIPDAPVNTFTVTVNKVVKVRKDACDKYASSRTIVGNATSFNGKSSPYNSDINIKCDGGATYRGTVSGKGKKAKAAINVKASSGSKLRTVTLSLPKGLTPMKKGLKKGLIVKADNRALKAKCFKLKGQKLVINFCGATPATADINFNTGSLNLSKKLKRAPMKMVSVFANGKSETVTLILSGKKFGTLNLQRAGL